MRLRRFQWLLCSRGPDLAAWPERDRVPALDLLRQSVAARQSLADAMAHDALPAPDTATQCRMLARLRHALGPASRAAWGMRWSVLAACVAAGVALGAALDLEPADLFTADLEGGYQVAALP